MPIEWVRIKDPDTGHELTISAEQANAVGATPIDKKSATSSFGEPLAPKYHTTVNEQAARKTAGKDA